MSSTNHFAEAKKKKKIPIEPGGGVGPDVRGVKSLSLLILQKQQIPDDLGGGVGSCFKEVHFVWLTFMNPMKCKNPKKCKWPPSASAQSFQRT